MKQRTVDAARGRWFSILMALGVKEDFLRNRHGPCPFCGGKDRYRFDDKDGNGTWFCSACGSGRGIEFVMRLKSCDFKEACALIDPLIGSAKIETARRKVDSRPMLRKIWSDSKPVGDDFVSQYLSSRHLRVPQTNDLRAHAGLSYWRDKTMVGKYQAMIAMVRAPSGDPVSLHVTYLQDGRKANIEPAKKIMTPIAKMAGGAVRLAEPKDGILAVAEGIESALAYTAIHGTPCWAATNATMLAQFVPPEGVTKVYVAGDNDANFAGHHASYALANRLAMSGLSVTVDIPSVTGWDWADVLAASRAASRQTV